MELSSGDRIHPHNTHQCLYLFLAIFVIGTEFYTNCNIEVCFLMFPGQTGDINRHECIKHSLIITKCPDDGMGRGVEPISISAMPK